MLNDQDGTRLDELDVKRFDLVGSAVFPMSAPAPRRSLGGSGDGVNGTAAAILNRPVVSLRPCRSDTAEDMRLIDQCKTGHKVAFDKLMRAYETRVFNFAHRLTGNRDDANDITSTTFLRLYKSIRLFRGDSKFITWLFRVVTNIYLDTRCRKATKLCQSLNEMMERDENSITSRMEDTAPLPSEVAEMNEREALIEDAIGALPEYQRKMVVMFHVNFQSYDEIAAILHVPLGTVKSRLNRARMTLREKLVKHTEYFVN
jgi:RNA polymerase sigma-70 factor (ECF subfamily)